MRRPPMSRRQLAGAFFLVVGSLASFTATAQEKPDSELYRTIAALDKAFFDAYNRCDVDTFRGFLAEDLEFYHDKDGEVTDREVLVEALRNNICGKVRRELVAGSLEVYPIEGVGALQMGVHLFHHPGREEIDGIGQGRFIHLWRRGEEDGWKLTRIFSFDHQPYDGK
jgi:ketosteroid isomerase-like protein